MDNGAAAGPRTWDGSTPPVIVNNVPGTWSYDTVNRRLREDILGRVFRDNATVLTPGSDAEIKLRRLEAELSTASTSVIEHITPDGGPDIETWREILDPWIGTTWLDAPWLLVEFYFYRRILNAIGYFDSESKLFNFDPFSVDKMNGLRAGAQAAASLAKKANSFSKRSKTASTLAEELRLFVMVALWGNRMDLSIWPESGSDGDGSNRASEAFVEALHAGEEYLLWDDSERVSTALAKGMRDVSIVVDNAGFELVSDLALADALITSGAVQRVILRVKAHPVFVSDAMDKDCRDTIDAMMKSEDEDTAVMGRRWAAHLSSGAWAITPDFAWCQPQPLWALPRKAHDDLKSSDLVIIKGDANYRRLLNDCLWELDTPFEDVSAYFPAPLLALRTLKAELGCGISRERQEMAKKEESWMVTGKYGVVQWNSNPARQFAVGSQIHECESFAGRDSSPTERLMLSKVLVALANASKELASALASAPLRGSELLGAAGGSNASGDSQQKLDVVANDIFKRHLTECGGVKYYASEEDDTPVVLNVDGGYVVCIDPLDGSRNIACNVPVGSIFGVYRAIEGASAEENAMQPGREQVAAGYAHYSGATTLVLACGDEGPAVEYTLFDGEFAVANKRMSCPPRGQVYSLNDARFDDWPEGLKSYINDIRNGRGESGSQYSARYICSLVGDAHRTLIYGGWCGNPRPHLRVVFEAAPLAFVARAAGAASSDGIRCSDEATNGVETILDKKPTTLHERSPLFLGSCEDIAELVLRGDVRQDGSKTYSV